MSGSDFNITDRRPSSVAVDILEVFSTNDLPPEIGGIRDFPMNQGLDIKATIFDEFIWRWPDESVIFIWTKHANSASIIYQGTTTFIQCDGRPRVFQLRNCILVGLSNNSNAKAWDLTASLNVGGGGFGVNDTVVAGFPGGARYKNFQNGIIRGMIYAPGVVGATVAESLTIENCGVYELTGMLMIAPGIGNQSLIATVGSATLQGRLHDNDYLAPASQSGINFGRNITSLAAMGAFSVSQTNTGTFFKTLETGSFSATGADNDTGTVTVVSNRMTPSGTFAVFETTNPPNEGDIIIHTGFPEASYNGTFLAHQVNVADYQIAQTPFLQPVLQIGSTGGGTWDRKYTVFTTTDTSELREGHSVEIFGTALYDAVHTVRNIITNTSFSIDFLFTAPTESGTFEVKSLIETDIQVDIDRAGKQKVSMTIGSFVIGGNDQATIIGTQNVFVDLNLSGGIVTGGNNERFTLINSTIGEVRYDGQNPKVLTVNGLIAATGSGGGQVFLFRALKNGVVLPAPDDVDIPIEIGNALSSTSIMWDISMVTGDLFRIQVANTAGNQNLVIDTLKLTIS